MKKSLLVKQCLAASIALHATALWIFYTQPVILQPVFSRLFGKMSPADVIPWKEEDIALSEKNISLEEVLNQVAILPSQWKKPFDLMQKEASLAPIRPHLEKNLYSFKPLEEEIGKNPLVDARPFPLAHVDILSNLDQVQQLPLIPYEASLDIPSIPLLQPEIAVEIFKAGEMDIEKVATSTESMDRPDIHYPALAEGSLPSAELNIPPISEPEFTAAIPSTLFAQGEWKPQDIPSLEFQPVDTLPQPSTLPTPSVRRLAPSFASYASVSSLTDTEWGQDFNVEVKTLKLAKDKYFFSISLKPHKNLPIPELQNNYYFLIDRSSSVEKKHYQTFKRAAVRALHSLKEGDKFNVYVFDTKLFKLSPEPLDYSQEAIAQAEEFLDKKEAGNFFSSTDLYALLPKVLPSSLPEDDFNVAILLSDGDAVSQRKKQQKKLKNWDSRKGDEIALYTAAVGKDNNLPLLELLSLLNRGSLTYSDTYASFPRKVAKLALDLSHPIAKEMQASVINPNKTNEISLFPHTGKLPALFRNRPYTIYGLTNNLADFTLLVQGKNREEMITIKKEISFKEATEDRTALKKAWNQEQAYLLYNKYLKEGDLSALEEAEVLLSGKSKKF